MSTNTLFGCSPRVIFVCTANTCRSPMAEALFRARIRQVRRDGMAWQVESAGISADDGQQASVNSCFAMLRRGLDLTGHRSRSVSEAMAHEADLVLAMEERHRAALLAAFPGLDGRIFLLGEMAGGTQPVKDPYGGSAEAYEETALLLEQMIDQGIPQIVSLVERSCLQRGVV